MISSKSKFELIEQELRTLYNDTKKKYLQLKEKLYIALIRVSDFNTKMKATQSSNHHQLHNQHPELKFPLDVIIQAVLLVPPTKHTQSIQQSLSLLQKLLNYELILEDNPVREVVNYLQQIIEIQQQQIQIKVLQTILLLINPKILDLRNFDIITKLYFLSFKLFIEKNLLIQNTSSATIFQLSDMIFDIYLQLHQQKTDTQTQAQLEKKKILLQKYLINKERSLMLTQRNIEKLIFQLVEITELKKPD